MKTTRSTPLSKIKAKPKEKVAPDGHHEQTYVVGFGASAGGLEAFAEVLKHLDPRLGMAYVLVMHLSPSHKSSLAEILQTKTKMKVLTVRDGMSIKPDTVYVIPANTMMSLADGRLKLEPRTAAKIGNFAVDYFFNTLASTYKNNSIA